MQVKTLGLLAALGMSLSSLTVWSLTTPHAADGPETIGSPPLGLGDAEPPPALTSDGARFVSGSTLLVEGRLGYETLEAAREHENFVFLDITTKSGLVGQQSPLNLAIVLDRSGSMKGKRLSNAVSAARGMIERLRDGDVVSLVTYNTTAEVKVASTEIDGRSRFTVLRELDDIAALGDTCISCGLEAANQLLARRVGMVNQMLLLSDGEATAGIKDESGFRSLAARIQRQGVTISTIGVDVDYNERVMSAIAEESNGRHHFVENADNLAHIFDQELKSLTNTVADEAELTVSLAPGVSIVEVYDRSFRRVGDQLIVPIGSLSAGDERTLLVKVLVPPGKPGERPIADVHLGYRDLVNGRRGDCEGSLSQSLVQDADKISPLDPLVAGRVERSETASVLSDANSLIKEGKSDAAWNLIKRARAKKQRARSAVMQNPFESATKGAKDLERDFDSQDKALAAAEESVAAGPSGVAPAPESRKAKAAVRQNQSMARSAGF